MSLRTLTLKKSKCISAIKDEDDLVQDKQLEQIRGHTKRVKGIQEIISRDRMKVAFFGR
jgi:hypothetical protein